MTTCSSTLVLENSMYIGIRQVIIHEAAESQTLVSDEVRARAHTHTHTYTHTYTHNVTYTNAQQKFWESDLYPLGISFLPARRLTVFQIRPLCSLHLSVRLTWSRTTADPGRDN